MVVMEFGRQSEYSFSSLCQQLNQTVEQHSPSSNFSQQVQSQSLKQLQDKLNYHRDGLLTPLKIPGPNAADREKVEKQTLVLLKGMRMKIDQFLKELAFEISRRLNLNELSAVSLAYEVSRQLESHFSRPNYAQMALSKCDEIFNDERYQNCYALFLLFKLRRADISESLHQFLINFTDGLIESGLLQNLSSTIIELFQGTKTSQSYCELVLLAQSLFLGCYDIQCKQTDVLKLLDTLSKLIEIHQSKPTDDSNTENKKLEDDSIRIILTVALSICAAIQPFKDRPNDLFNRSDFVSSFNSALQRLKPPTSQPLQLQILGLLGLAWSTCHDIESIHHVNTTASPIDHSRDAERERMKIEAFNYATTYYAFEFICNKAIPILTKDFIPLDQQNHASTIGDFRVAVLDVIFCLATDVISSCALQLDDLFKQQVELFSKHKRQEEMDRQKQTLSSSYYLYDDFYAQGSENSDNVAPHPYFENLLKLLGASLQKEIIPTFWSQEAITEFTDDDSYALANLERFISLTCPYYAVPLFIRGGVDAWVSFLDLLSSLSMTEEGADKTFKVLQAIEFKEMRLDFFFEILRPERFEYLNRQEEQQQAREPYMISEKDLPHNNNEVHESILELLEKLIGNCSRINVDIILESVRWSTLNTLMNIVLQPNVPASLRGRGWRVLGQCSKHSRQVGSQIWQLIQNANMIVQTTGQLYQQSNQTQPVQSVMKYQLYKFEGSTGCYSETLGFLNVLNVLIKYCGIPNDLGKGTRYPGFSPYLAFIIDDILLKFDTRYYATGYEQHKWLMAQHALDILLSLVTAYTPHPSHFSDKVAMVQIASSEHVTTFDDASRTVQVAVPKPPGFEILATLFTESRGRSQLMGKLQAIILGSSISQLEQERRAMVKQDDGMSAHELCVVHTLAIFEQALSKQQVFTEASLASRPSADYEQQQNALNQNMPEQFLTQDQEIVIVNPLDNRLVGSEELIMQVAQYINFRYNAKLRLHSCELLKLICDTKAPKVASIFMKNQTPTGSVNVLQLFVNRIGGTADVEDLSDQDDALILEYNARIALLQMLINNVNAPLPNLTHWLCGFNETTRIPSPYESSTIYTENVLSVVCKLIRQQQTATTLHTSPQNARFMELCYELVHALCADRRISRSTLATLERYNLFTNQTTVMFLARDSSMRHISENISGNPDLELSYHHFMNQQAYILKIVALKIYVQASSKQNSDRSLRGDNKSGRSAVQQLVNLLFSTNDAMLQYADSAEIEDQDDMFSPQNAQDAVEQQKIPILELLDSVVNMIIDNPANPVSLFAGEDTAFLRNALHAFYQQKRRSSAGLEATISALMSEFTSTDSNGVVAFNIPALNNILMHAVSMYSVTMNPQTQSGKGIQSLSTDQIKRSIEIVLKRAVQWNRVYQLYTSIYNAFNGWKQVVEITLAKGYDMLESELSRTVDEGDQQNRERVLVTILNAVLAKLNKLLMGSRTNWNETTERIHYYSSISNLQQSMAQVALRLMTKLREQQKYETQNILADHENIDQTIVTEDNFIYRLPAIDNCTEILNGILACILNGDVTSATTRGNLYSTLLNYLHYSRKRFVFSYYQQVLMDKANDNLLQRTDNQLIARIGRDALDGKNNVWKAVAFATLDSLFNKRIMKYSNKAESPAIQLRWIEFMEQNGLLQQIIDQLCYDQTALLSVVSQRSSSMGEEEMHLNKLFIYESIMSMLLRISSINAETLCKFNIMHIFTHHFKFIECRPSDEEIGEIMEDDDADSAQRKSNRYTIAMERYHQLVLPLLRIIVSIFTSLHANRRIAEQVLSFISEHHKAISAILKVKNLSTDNNSEFDSFVMEEMKLVTSMFYLLGSHPELKQQKLSNSTRISKYEILMLNLLARFATAKQFWNPTKPIPQVNPATISAEAYDEYQQNVAQEKEKQEVHEYIRDICKNIISWCRLETQHSLQSNLSVSARILFRFDLSTSQPMQSANNATLNVLFSLLDNVLRFSLQYMNALQQAYDQRQQQRDLYDQDQGKQIERATDISEVDDLKTIVHSKLAAYTYIAENTALVLLRHLTYFLSSQQLLPESNLLDPTLTLSHESGLSDQQKQQLVRDADKRLHEALTAINKNKSTFNSDFLIFLARELKDLLSKR